MLKKQCLVTLNLKTTPFVLFFFYFYDIIWPKNSFSERFNKYVKYHKRKNGKSIVIS